MAKYESFLIGDPRRPAYDVVLKRASLEEMWTPQIRALDGEGVNGPDSPAALSFFVERYDSVELVGHSGDQNGFISHLYLHRPSRTAWLLAMNTDTTPSQDRSRPGSREVDATVRELILKHLLGPPPSAVADEKLPGP